MPPVEQLVKGEEQESGGDRGNFHWIPGRPDIRGEGGPLGVHERIRGIVREEAARLG